MNKRFRLVLALFIGFFSTCCTLLVSSSVILAASPSTDPMVAIAVDVTFQGTCMNTVIFDVGTPHQSTVHYPCTAGSIMRNESVHLSHALQLHKRYVLLPSLHASAAIWKQTTFQIEALIESEWRSIRYSSHQHNVVPYLTSCGKTNSASRAWSAGYTALFSYVAFMRNSDPNCNKLSLNFRKLQLNGSESTILWWDHDQYQGYWWGTGCPQITSAGSSFSSNNTVDAGYYYENWVKDNPCVWGSGTFYHNDMLLN